MAKSEGGLGLDEGVINFEQIAELINFSMNQNNGVVLKRAPASLGAINQSPQSTNTNSSGAQDRQPIMPTDYQSNLYTDLHMNHLIQVLK